MSANSRLTIAVHALCWLELARRGGRHALSSAEIADSLASHPVLVRRTLAPLRDRGLLEVIGRGPGAGWRLARPAAAVTLADVHSALEEGPGPFDLHPHEPKPTCPVGYGIRPVLRDVYCQVQAAISTVLTTRTIADVLDTTLAEHPLPTTSADHASGAAPMLHEAGK
jgi:Rrf2 family protein